MARRARGYLASEARKAARAMRPDRVFLRFMTGGKYQTFGGLVRGAVGASNSRPIPMRPVPLGSAVPKTDAAARRARAVAAKKQAAKQAAKKTARGGQAAARKRAAGKTQVPKRNPDGTFDGSVTFPTFGPAEQAAYERALTGQVDPGQQVRQPRRRK